ncbi:MAG: hypothetical protein N3B16_02105 [Candidatus Aminicenantes bacterium]|nr:hypothetical protein [Candidatus Aminicenantes bacterium]
MIKPTKRGNRFWLFLFSFSLIFIFQIYPADKKLRVIKEGTAVHLYPDEKSPVLESLNRGTIVSLLAPGKLKAFWYYVSFQSTSGSVKSGYIHESFVEPLFQAQKIVTIKGEESNYVSAFNFCHLNPSLWGESIEKVLSLQGEPNEKRTLENLDVFEYQRELKDYLAIIEFIFNKNKLIQIHVEFWQIAGTKNIPLRDYEQIKNCLSATFGLPLEDNIHWQNPTFQYDELSWGYAISLGHLFYETRWASSELELLLRLRGENRTICLEFEGTHFDYRELAKKVTRNRSFR